MIYRNFSLQKYNSFGLDYKADRFIVVKSIEEFSELVGEKKELDAPCFILGGGSNILFVSDYSGTIIHPAIEGIEIEKDDGESVLVSAGAGVEWDSLVEWSVEKGLYGLENLLLIPGSVGAAPVQNIGAYGKEASEIIDKVVAVDISNGTIKTFTNEECRFNYRDSVFKRELKGKYLIVKVFFKMSVNSCFNLNYGSLETEVNRFGGATLRNVRQAVINIRNSKLPDPKILGNAGSFFKNPVVDSHKADLLKSAFPEMPVYSDKSGLIKLSAAWLIEKCGWKEKRHRDAGVHEKQALVIVNHGKATGRQIVELSENIKCSVAEMFGIELESEVEVVGTI